MQKHWSNSQNDGQHKISSLADYILWYIHTAVLYNMKHCECLLFYFFFFISFLLVLAEALFCCDSVLLFQFFHRCISTCAVCMGACMVGRTLCESVCRWYPSVDVCSFQLGFSILHSIHTQPSAYFAQLQTLIQRVHNIFFITHAVIDTFCTLRSTSVCVCVCVAVAWCICVRLRSVNRSSLCVCMCVCSLQMFAI